MTSNPLLTVLTEVFGLLQKTQPLVDETDVSWVGPYYIPRSGVWAPTYFRIHNMRLCVFVSMPDRDSSMVWDLRSRQWEFESPLPFGFGANSEEFWRDVLTQVNRRLIHALKNTQAYNRAVEARLPFACRTGKIQRTFTWLEGEEPEIDEGTLQKLESMLSFVESSPRLKKLTVFDYLTTASIAYDAAFENMGTLYPLEKYRSRADGRHGGMLDLPLTNAKAFTRWFNSQRWAGTHPWEIVYADPHGVMLSPRRDETTSAWSFDFSVHTERLYAIAVKMAIALARQAIPLEFYNSAKVVAVLRGEDMVEVGPSHQPLEFEQLKAIRPDSIEHIQWDPIPQISPISADQWQRLNGLITVIHKPSRKITRGVKAIQQRQAVGIPNEEIKERITAKVSKEGPATEHGEEEKST
jgi:hypothetical protein